MTVLEYWGIPIQFWKLLEPEFRKELIQIFKDDTKSQKNNSISSPGN